jgi:3-oxoacyl-[acyl-carrier-protein] synthase III
MVTWKPKRKVGVTYLIEHDAASDRWNISRDGMQTGAFAKDKSTAIRQACQAASREAISSEQKISVYSLQAMKRTKEWESP